MPRCFIALMANARKVGEVGMKMFRMVCALYLPMEENETQEQAEDRALELIEDAGMEVYSWWNAETVNIADEQEGR